MNEFYRRFLAEDLRAAGGSPNPTRCLCLAAFGKHPGWDDHIEDLGVETEGLVAAKRLFYVQGIGGQIDSGSWEKMDPNHQLPAFKHLFAWFRGHQFLLGRLWSSSDGKGRTRYPMFVVAHCAGVRINWAARQIFPRLEELEQICALSRLHTDVRDALDRARTDLRQLFVQAPSDTQHIFRQSGSLARFVEHAALGPDREGWYRLLYEMHGQMAPFAPGRFNARSDPSTMAPQQVRVPAAGENSIDTLLLWARFFQAQLDPNVPVLLTLPLQESWLDVTVGEPGTREFFCLRANPKAMPLVTDVPYTLNPDFRRQARERMDAFAAGDSEESGVDAPAGRAADADSTARRLFRWFTGRAPSLF